MKKMIIIKLMTKKKKKQRKRKTNINEIIIIPVSIGFYKTNWYFHRSIDLLMIFLDQFIYLYNNLRNAEFQLGIELEELI